MATTFKLEGKVDINAAAAQAAVQALSANFVKLSSNSRTSAATLAKLAPILKEAARAADVERRSLAAAEKAQQQANKTKRESLAIARLTNARTDATKQSASDKAAIADAQRLLTLNKAQTEAVRQQMLVADANSKIAARTAQTQIANSRLVLAQQKAQIAAQRQVNQANEDGLLSLTGIRYGLFSVSAAAAMAGAAMTGMAVAGYGTGIAWQKAFAEVSRTSGVLNIGDVDKQQLAIKSLQGQFQELVTTIPVAYDELAKIGTLAGQLGVDRSNIGEFTKIVAEFSATTDVSTEAAATAFGRLSAIIGDVDGDYLGLADSILKVGVNSVASESQIINVTTQIASIADQAGFSYQQIIGLSGALASIGVPPELSRGVITRVFGDISRAASTGGTRLEQFGKITGMTGAEFKAAWSEDAAGTFQSFMRGIQASGSDAEANIRELGITSVRDVPILLRLANAADSANNKGGLLAQTMQDAATATGELQKQYAIISGTVGAKIQVLFQNIQAAIATISGTQLGAFGDLLDDITTNVRRFTDALDDNVRVLDMFELPFSNAEALGVALTIAGIVGAIGLLIAVLGKVASGGIAVVQVWRTVGAHFAASAASVGTSTAALTANTGALRANATAAGLVGRNVGAAGLTYRGLTNVVGAASPGFARFNAGLATTGDALRGFGGPLMGRINTGLANMGDKLRGLGRTMGPELAAAGTLALAAAILQAEANARQLGSTATETANAFITAKDGADLLGKIDTNRGGWLSGLGIGEDVHGFLTDINDLGKGLDNIKGNGMWNDMNHVFKDMFQVGSDTNFANMTNGITKLNDGFAEMVQAGNAVEANKQMSEIIKSAKLTDDQLDTFIERMPEYKHALEQGLNSAELEHTDANMRKLARGGMEELSRAAAGLAGISDQAIDGFFEGSSDDALEFIDQVSGVTDSLFDFGNAYQETLDRVNEKGKDAWVKAGNDVADYVDVATANLGDYFETIDQMIGKDRAKMANIARIVLEAGPEYLDAANALGADVAQQLVDGMNNGDYSGFETFLRQADETSQEAKDLISRNLVAAATNPLLYDRFKQLGGGSMQAFSDAITKGDRSVDQILADLQAQFDGEPISIPFKGNKGPAMADLNDTKAYGEAMEIYLTARGNAAPARDDFKNEQDFQAGLTYWLNARGNTAPARSDFQDERTYQEGLQLWLSVHANTGPGAADLSLFRYNQEGDNVDLDAKANTSSAEADLNWAARDRTVKFIGGGGSFATGGAVFGPGSGTSDSIVARLSNGEHVLTARDVAAMGGQAGVYAFRKSLRSSPGFASGGEVSDSSANYAASYASRQSTAVARSTGPMMVELSARDRQLLARIPDGLQLRIGNEVVARANNASNLNSGTRGTN